jgi:hypothetical protein
MLQRVSLTAVEVGYNGPISSLKVRDVAENQAILVNYLRRRASLVVASVIRKFPMYAEIKEDLEQDLLVRALEALEKPRYSTMPWVEFEKFLTVLYRNHLNNFFRRHKYWSPHECQDSENQKKQEKIVHISPEMLDDVGKFFAIYVHRILARIDDQDKANEFLRVLSTQCPDIRTAILQDSTLRKCVISVLAGDGLDLDEFVYLAGLAAEGKTMSEFTKADLQQVARDLGYNGELTGSTFMMDLQLEKMLQQLIDEASGEDIQLTDVSEVTERWLVEHGFLEPDAGAAEPIQKGLAEQEVAPVEEEQDQTEPEEKSENPPAPSAPPVKRSRRPKTKVQELAEKTEKDHLVAGVHQRKVQNEKSRPPKMDRLELSEEAGIPSVKKGSFKDVSILRTKLRVQLQDALDKIVGLFGQNRSVLLNLNPNGDLVVSPGRKLGKRYVGRKPTEYSPEEEEQVGKILHRLSKLDSAGIRKLLAETKLPESEAKRRGLTGDATLLDCLNEVSKTGNPIPPNVWKMRAKRLLITYAAHKVSGRKIGY